MILKNNCYERQGGLQGYGGQANMPWQQGGGLEANPWERGGQDGNPGHRSLTGTYWQQQPGNPPWQHQQQQGKPIPLKPISVTPSRYPICNRGSVGYSRREGLH